MQVSWIKLQTNIFDDDKISLIEQMPSGESIILIWIRLICLAGKINDRGLIYLTPKIPYTIETLSKVFRKDFSIIKNALEVFIDLEMITIFEDGKMALLNWEKHQNIDGLEKIRKDTRNRVRRHREKQKMLHVTKGDPHNDNKINELEGCNVTVTLRNATEENKNRIRKENKEKKEQKKETPQPPEGEHVFSDDKIKKAEKLYIQKIGKSQLELLQNSEIAKSLSLRKKRILSDWLQHKKEIKSQIKTQRGMDGLCKKFKGHSEKVLFELVKFSAEDNNYKGLIWKKADEFAEKVEKGKKEKRMYPTYDKVNARDNDPEYIKECLRIHREKQEEDLARFAKRVKVDYWAS